MKEPQSGSRSKNIVKRIKESIYSNSSNPPTEEGRVKTATKSLILHLHPALIPKRALTLRRTWGLGGIAVLLFFIQALTGALLRFVYEPFPGKAYESIIHIQDDLIFGQLVRNLHHWSGTFLIIVVSLHLLRVYFTGSFHGNRQFNWAVGICLLFFVIFSNFTGYLLPWDQLAYWAVIVSTNMLSYIPVFGDQVRQLVRGGSDVGAPTLLIFYNLHTGILPLIAVTLMAFHFWRVRKSGGIALPKSNERKEEEYITTIPNLVGRELSAALVIIAFLLLLASFFNAPLLAKANTAFSANPAKAPWYFQGIQELMLHFHPFFAAIIIPLSVSVLLILLPYFNYDNTEIGIWFISGKGKKMGMIATAAALIITPLFIIADEYFYDANDLFGSLPGILSNGFIPLSILLVIFFALYYFMKNKFEATNNETIQSLFIFLLISFITFTFTCVLFRGPGMELIF